MITRKVGRIIYAWSPNALNGRGWWFELGKDGNLGLAATRALGTRLGKPKASEQPPKNADKKRYEYDSKMVADAQKKGADKRAGEYYYDIGKTGRTAGKCKT